MNRDIIVHCTNEAEWDDVRAHIVENKKNWSHTDNWKRAGERSPCINLTQGMHGTVDSYKNDVILSYQKWSEPRNVNNGVDIITDLIGI